MQYCLKKESVCAYDCLNQVVAVSSEHNHHQKHNGVKSSATETCAKDCAVDFGKCLVQTYDMEACLNGQNTCTNDCLKGVKFIAKWDDAVVPYVKVKDVGTCQKNCGIDMGKCLILIGDAAQCIKEEAACSLDCLKVQSLTTKELEVEATENVCVYDCGVNYS